MPLNFGPACEGEKIVFGAARPGRYGTTYDRLEASTWVEFMKDRGIKRVCCLLDESQLAEYPFSLIDYYKEQFGQEKVCEAPIWDFSYCPKETLLGKILPFLQSANDANEPVVVHCSAGCGRTGHVLAAWLIAGRGMSVKEASKRVMVPGVIRNVAEAGSSEGLSEVFGWAEQYWREHGKGATPL